MVGENMKTKKYIIKTLIFLTIICLFKHQNVYATLVHDDLPLKKVAEFSRDSYYMQGFTITNKYLIFVLLILLLLLILKFMFMIKTLIN